MSTKVKDIMIRNVKTASTEDTVLKAAEIMNQHEIGCVIVTEDEKPVGILTERDILKRVVYKRKDPAKAKVREVMSNPLITVKSTMAIMRALQIMIKQKIKKLAVTNGDQLVGVLSLTDLVPLLQTKKLSLKDAPNHVKKVFEIYYDPIRRRRKNCPLTMSRGMAISCTGPKCMWYVSDKCIFLSLAEKISS